jgi:AraC family transcriptional regulator, regulatory protein of adaptative response / DNA-3-methyladenine glycosylase II
VFPRASALAGAKFTGLPQARVRSIQSLARATLDGEVIFDNKLASSELLSRFTSIDGIGEWTAHYVAMRALGDPDAFPAADLALLRAAGQGNPLTPAALLKRAENWRPWRAYAAMYLWRAAADEQMKRKHSLKMEK